MSKGGKILPLNSLIEEPSHVYTCIFDGEDVVVGQKRTNTWAKATFPIASSRGNRRTIGSTSFDLFPGLACSSRDSGVSLMNSKPLVLPGGMSTAGENIWDASKRTFFECTGFDITCFTAAPKLARIRAKRFDDKFDGRYVAYYVLYINMAELSSSDARRGVGVYEPGQTIYNNFNVGPNSKKAFRKALNSHQPTDSPPLVMNDELDFVEMRPIYEVVDLPTKRSSSATLNCSFDELSVDDNNNVTDMDADRLKTIVLERDLVCGTGCVTRKPAFDSPSRSPSSQGLVQFRDDLSPVSFRDSHCSSGGGSAASGQGSRPSSASKAAGTGLSNFTRSIVIRNLNSSRK